MTLSGPAAQGEVAAGSGIVVGGPGGVRFEPTAAEVTTGGPEVVSGNYMLRAHSGEAGEGVQRTGLPVEVLIERAGLQPGEIGYLTVPRPDGSVAYLPGTDFTAESSFEEEPALVTTDSGCGRFFRPVIGAGVNAEDNIAICGAPLAIAVRDGAILQVQASAAPTDPTVGAAVAFSAAAQGALAGEEVTFHWSFGDGSTAEGPSVSHAYAQAGSYRVAVTAVGSEESGGESAPLTIVVGNPPVQAGVGAGPALPKKKTKPHGTGGGGKKKNGAGKKGTGGSKEGGGSGHGSRGGGSGAAGSKGSQGTGAKAKGGDGGNSTTQPAEEAAEPLPATPSAETIPFSELLPAAPEPLPVAPEPLATIPAPAAPELPASSPGPHGAAHSGKQSSGAREVGRTVSGELVADLLEPGAAGPGSEGAGSEPGPESFASAPGGGSGGTVPVAALIVAALLGAGVLLEWRGLPLWWRR